MESTQESTSKRTFRELGDFSKFLADTFVKKLEELGLNYNCKTDFEKANSPISLRTLYNLKKGLPIRKDKLKSLCAFLGIDFDATIVVSKVIVL